MTNKDLNDAYLQLPFTSLQKRSFLLSVRESVISLKPSHLACVQLPQYLPNY